MKPAVVVDVGNTRIKWGRCSATAVEQRSSLPHAAPDAWQAQWTAWGLSGVLTWAVSGVVPQSRDRFLDWLKARGQQTWLLEHHRQLPLSVQVEQPERVGMDRLLNAVAAKARLEQAGRRGQRAILIDAGTAVTVDLLGPQGEFQGGAIFPGRRLMATALHQYTALLPLVCGDSPQPAPVGKNTATAIETGIHHAVAGGINLLLQRQLGFGIPPVEMTGSPAIFLTGGDAPLLQADIDPRAELWPAMTLEGIRLAAEAQP